MASAPKFGLGRKAEYNAFNIYFNEESIKNIFVKLVYFAGILTPIMTLPQFYNIWFDHNVTGVSLLSWASYLFVSTIFTIYGFLLKEKPMIIMYLSQLFIQVFIVIGIIIYG